MLSYSLQYIKKCSSSSMEFLLQIKHVLSSTEIDALYFKIFQFVYTLNGSLVAILKYLFCVLGF